jgi:hypothetical protein
LAYCGPAGAPGVLVVTGAFDAGGWAFEGGAWFSGGWVAA